MGWINTAAAAVLLDVTRPAAVRTLKGLTADGFLYSHELHGMPKRLWYSISETGMEEAFFLEDMPLSASIQTGRWKIAPQNYQHEQDVLIFAIQAQKAGADIRLPEPQGNNGRAKAGKYPDLLVEINEHVFGIEIEREAKSQRRYKDIIASHWLAMEREQYDGVLYLTPDQATRDRVGRVVKSVFDRVRIGGRERALSEPERQKFLFGKYVQGITFIKKYGGKNDDKD